MSDDKTPRDAVKWFDPLDIEIHDNPRKTSNPGWSPENMARLREDIRRYGLKQNLEVRQMEDGKIRLIAGGRRLRCILLLREQEAKCYNRGSMQYEPADEVYAVIPCTVTECATDLDAMRAAVAENLLHEHLTDYELLLQCDNLEKAEVSRAEQAQMFEKSEAWISQSHSLLNGHPEVLEALASGILGRTQALQFLTVPREKVKAVIQKAIEFSKMEFEQKEQDLLAERDKTYESIEHHESVMQVAEAMGDEEAAEAARLKLAEDEKLAEAQERRIKKNKSGGRRRPRPSINNIQQAKDAEGADDSTRPWLVKLQRRAAQKLTELLKSGEALVNAATGQEYSRREVRIVRDVIECLLSENDMKDPLEALSVNDDDNEVALAG